METQMETVFEMETSYLPHANLDPAATKSDAAPEASESLRVYISEEFNYDEQIHDDKAGGERVGSVRGNCVQVGAWRHHPGQAFRKTDHQDPVRRSRAPGESEASGSSELETRSEEV